MTGCLLQKQQNIEKAFFKSLVETAQLFKCPNLCLEHSRFNINQRNNCVKDWKHHFLC